MSPAMLGIVLDCETKMVDHTDISPDLGPTVQWESPDLEMAC